MLLFFLLRICLFALQAALRRSFGDPFYAGVGCDCAVAQSRLQRHRARSGEYFN